MDGAGGIGGLCGDRSRIREVVRAPLPGWRCDGRVIDNAGKHGIMFTSIPLGVWCNGSTTDSDSVCLGSNPSTPVFANPLVLQGGFSLGQQKSDGDKKPTPVPVRCF
jgi:hypothetical protein